MARPYLRLVLALGLLLVGCTSTQGGIPALNPTAGPENAVARITYRDGTTEYIAQATLDQFQQLFGGPGQPAPAAPVLDELLTRQLLLRQARNRDIVAEAQEVEAFVENVRTNPQACGSRVQQAPPGPGEDTRAYFDECAKAFGFTDGSAFRNFLAEQLTINEIASREAEQDQIQAAHILWTAKEDPAQSQEDYVTAYRTYEQLCGSPGNQTVPRERRCPNADEFTQLARQLSEEPGAAESGGELPPFNEQGVTDDGTPFDTTFVSQTWALKQQFLDQGVAISEPFETQFGWHIVKVLDLLASQESGQRYREAVLQRAKEATPADLQQADTGDVPLIGAVEILVELPSPPAVPTIEPPVPVETPTPEATSEVPAEGTPEPAVDTTPETTDGAPAEGTAEPELDTTTTATP